jgi:hypothetical protein
MLAAEAVLHITVVRQVLVDLVVVETLVQPEEVIMVLQVQPILVVVEAVELL